MSQPAASLATDTAQAWRSPLLGERRAIDLPQGTIEYFERGRGPTLVLVHGWLVNANLWRKVVDALHGDFRCLTLDLPLGSHRLAMSAAADPRPRRDRRPHRVRPGPARTHGRDAGLQR